MQTGRVGAAPALAAAALVLWPTAPGARATGEAFIPAEAVTQPWPIKDFEVLNVEPTGGDIAFVSLGLVALLQALTLDPDNPLDLDIWKTVPLPDAVRTGLEITRHTRLGGSCCAPDGRADRGVERAGPADPRRDSDRG